jgi:signal transduction histidine kinase
VRALHADPDGIVWAGIEGGGLVRLTRARVAAYRVGENDRQGRVNGMAEAPDGQLWVTTFGRGLLHGPPDRLEPVPGFDRAKPLRAALRMSDGSLYVSGYRQLARRAPATGAVRSWTIAEDPTALCEGADGALWAGTNAGDLKRLAGDAFEAVPGGTFGYPVTGIARGPGAALWVATRGAGLFRWEAGRTRRWTTADGLPTDLLQALYADADGTLWIGTAGGGIAWLDAGGGAERARAVGPRQGLGDGVVSQILDDGRGHLWVGGLRGLRRLAKAELRAVADAKVGAAIHPLVLDESDGMTTAECTAGFAPAGLLARSGIMYFSTVRGVVAIDPAAVNPAPDPPPVRIESVRCDGRAVTPGAGGDLVLPPGSKELEIRYTGFDGAKPEQLRFRHRLHRDAAWQYVEGARDVRYSALRPGAYDFELSAANADGHWLKPGARLAITVRPYVWQTAAFRTGVATVLCAVALGLVAVAMRRKDRLHRAELAQQHALADAEREIAVQRDELAHLSRVTTMGVLTGSMAHELAQPLTAILNNAEAALRFMTNGTADPGEVREILQDIVDDDRRATDVISRLRLLFTKGEVQYQRLAPGEVVRDVLRLLRGDLTKHGVVVREAVDDALPPVYGDRVQLQQVLINLVINACDAMRAARPAGRELTIRAALTPDRSAVRLSVTDNGPGLPPGRLEQVFEPFVTTKAHGMGLGLAVCRTIITAHGGRLFAEHADGGGARFVLELLAARSDAVTAA